jgi:hypothetical protein
MVAIGHLCLEAKVTIIIIIKSHDGRRRWSTYVHDGVEMSKALARLVLFSCDKSWTQLAQGNLDQVAVGSDLGFPVVMVNGLKREIRVTF